jgi:hypothetical protein
MKSLAKGKTTGPGALIDGIFHEFTVGMVAAGFLSYSNRPIIRNAGSSAECFVVVASAHAPFDSRKILLY